MGLWNLQWFQDLLKDIDQKKCFPSPVAMKLTDALEIEFIGIFDVNLLQNADISLRKCLDFWFKSKVRERKRVNVKL